MMKKTDLFFVGIIAGIILLIAVSLVVMFTSDASEYKDESTPDSTALNYLLAVQNEDYSRAYSYLSKTIDDYPVNVKAFETQISQFYYVGARTEYVFSIESIDQTGSTADIMLTSMRFSGDALFGGRQYTDRFEMTLIREAGGWKITSCSSYAFCTGQWRK